MTPAERNALRGHEMSMAHQDVRSNQDESARLSRHGAGIRDLGPADEPTTALDVTVQKQVIDLLNELREKLGFAMVFVSYDGPRSCWHRITGCTRARWLSRRPPASCWPTWLHEYTWGLGAALHRVRLRDSTRCEGSSPHPARVRQATALRSSHPTVGSETRPVLKPAPARRSTATPSPRAEALLAKEKDVPQHVLSSSWSETSRSSSSERQCHSQSPHRWPTLPGHGSCNNDRSQSSVEETLGLGESVAVFTTARVMVERC